MPFLVVPFPPGFSLVGKSVSEYIRRLRLERTASQPKLGKEHVTQIAFDAEYSGYRADARLETTAMLRHIYGEATLLTVGSQGSLTPTSDNSGKCSVFVLDR